MYNPLRALRPGSQAKQNDQYVKQIIKKARIGCHFCDAEKNTVIITFQTISLDH